MYSIGQKFTGKYPPMAAVWCNQNRAFIAKLDSGEYEIQALPVPPEPTIDEQAHVREIRNQMLEESDKYMIVDFPLTDEERYQMKLYRQYLRDYTKQNNWWENLPDNFADWRANIAKVDEMLKESTKTETRI